jgi:hypothetical protein
VQGIAVHIAARIASLEAASEILVSRTDLVFNDRGKMKKAGCDEMKEAAH